MNMSIKIRMRKGSKQGYGHIRLGFNNQDAALCETFFVPMFKKNYWVGLVSDGSTGNPLFSRTEVGSNLMVLYAYRRIQELICSGMTLENIPIALYPSITEFLLNIMGWVMPETVIWPYPAGLPDREKWSSQKRFRVDYLAATLIGFIAELGSDNSSDDKIVLFSAGDGVKLVNDEVVVIDQDDRPLYPAITINQAGAGFVVDVLYAADIYRLSIATDGLKYLMQEPEFVEQMFTREPEYLGLQFLLNTTDRPDLMKDDCTAVTWEVFKEDD
jgi:hypothetical protein